MKKSGKNKDNESTEAVRTTVTLTDEDFGEYSENETASGVLKNPTGNSERGNKSRTRNSMRASVLDNAGEGIGGEPSFNNSVISAAFQEADAQENILRPKFLEDFQGQDRIKENLGVFIRAARERGEALDHVFLIGPPGLGKTTLASIVANEMGAEIKMTSAPALDKPKDLAGILTNVTEGSIFFIDEIHRLKPALEEMLYIAMEDFEIDWVIGQGPSARTMRIPIPHFTLVGATTKAGMVSSPLQSRFGINCRLEFYDEVELSRIIRRSASLIDVKIDDDAVCLLSKCARGTPRIANRLLRRLRDFAEVTGNGTITSDIVHASISKLGIDLNGLEDQDRNILRTIIEFYNGGPVGAETLCISVGEAIESLEDYYEPYLIQKGYLKRTPRGRMVTSKAYELLNLTDKMPQAIRLDSSPQGMLF